MKKPEHSSKIHPSLDKKPGISNWVDKVGGLPDYIERIAKHIHSDSKLPIDHSIAAAVTRCKELAAKGNAQAIKAIAEWEAKKKMTGGPKKKPAVKLANEMKAPSFRSVGGVRSVVAGSHSRIRNRGTAIGSTARQFNENKIIRDPTGKFDNKADPAALAAARRVVEAAILALQVGASVNLPGGIGWVQRTDGGYMIQGSAGQRIVVRTGSEAVEAAASVLAAKANPKG